LIVLKDESMFDMSTILRWWGKCGIVILLHITFHEEVIGELLEWFEEYNYVFSYRG